MQCAWQRYEYEVGFSEAPYFVNVRNILKSRLSCGSHKRWELYCVSAESSGASNDITVETLWEVRCTGLFFIIGTLLERYSLSF